MQAAEFADQLMPGPEIQMIRVGENDFGVQLFERLLPKSLNARGGAHGKKEWRLNHAVWGGQPPAARASRIGLDYLKGKTHRSSVSGGDDGPTYAR